MTTTNHVGSNLSQTIEHLPKLVENADKKVTGIGAEALGSGSFTTFFTWRANGVFQAARFDHPSVNANSRVFVSISEFNSDARINRFNGSARMAVYNVAPFNGGFFVWVEISWGSPLNVRFDVLVDP
jgi:hypothetical protein